MAKRLSQFGSYYLPPQKLGSLQFSGQLVDATTQADNISGRLPYLGTDAMPLDEATVQGTFILSPSFLAKPIPGSSDAYDVSEAGIEAAKYDFGQLVIAAGSKTLTMLPVVSAGGTQPTAGIASYSAFYTNQITSWTCKARVIDSYTTIDNVNGAMVYTEITITFLVDGDGWTINTAGGTLPSPLV
jgi:hypothetical protein